MSLFSWPGYGFWYVAKEKNLVPEIDWDITPGWGGTSRLARFAGRRKAKEWNLLGALFGLESRVTGEVEVAGRRFAPRGPAHAMAAGIGLALILIGMALNSAANAARCSSGSLVSRASPIAVPSSSSSDSIDCTTLPRSSVGGTRNLDFWFADEAVLVAAAGRPCVRLLGDALRHAECRLQRRPEAPRRAEPGHGPQHGLTRLAQRRQVRE